MRLSGCHPCAVDTYSVSPMADDRICTACPNGTVSPSLGGSYCMCRGGYYRSSDICVACGIGSYCAAEQIYRCPEYSSTTTPFSQSRGDCICDRGYYGYLADPSQICLPLPVGSHCADERGMNAVDCSCLSGWSATPVLEGTLSFVLFYLFYLFVLYFRGKHLLVYLLHFLEQVAAFGLFTVCLMHNAVLGIM